jgi:hypothetical protein
MYYLSTRTSWQKKPQKLGLTDVREALSEYPLIEKKFFNDLNQLCRKENQYVVEMGLLHLINNKKKKLNPDLWILLWAKDFRDRIFQILIERHPDYKGKGAIAALGPPDLLEFFSSMKHNAILPTLTLLTTPEKIKSFYVVVSRPESYKKKQKKKQNFQALARFQKWIHQLKQTPKCPICGGPLVGIQDQYRVGFGYMICPECGYNHREKIKKNRHF